MVDLRQSDAQCRNSALRFYSRFLSLFHPIHHSLHESTQTQKAQKVKEVQRYHHWRTKSSPCSMISFYIKFTLKYSNADLSIFTSNPALVVKVEICNFLTKS